jgi:DNA-directed RNA polymerase subunit RPC12/RpoP
MQHEHVDAACPKCKSRYLRRSRHTGFFSRLISRWKGQLPYRCMNCDFRFLIFISGGEELESAHELQSRRAK